MEVIINKVYREEYGEPTINPLDEISKVDINNMDDDQGSCNGDHRVQNQDRSEATFGFPNLDKKMGITLKNIPPSIFPQFHGIPTKDCDAFLFKFDILCRIITIIKIGIN